MKKLYDLAVKTGSYMKDGIEKGRYENVGSIMEGDKGDNRKFIFLKRSFNPAGVPFREGTESIIVSMFAPKNGTATENIPEPQAPPAGEDIPW